VTGSKAQLFADEAIYRRTASGHRALVHDLPQIPRRAHRLLSLANGYTPLRDLLELAFRDIDVRSELEYLFEAGFIELAPPPRPSQF
jgi:hypothetical protein